MNRQLYFASDLGAGSTTSSYPTSERRVPVDTEDQANLISSNTGETTDETWSGDTEPVHMPALDIDFPVRVVPSETEGHFHLFLDKPMAWSDYRDLLYALGQAGILEPGYVRASIERGATYVATRPWKQGVAA